MTVTEMMVAIFIATSRSEAAGNVAMLVRKRYLSVAPARPRLQRESAIMKMTHCVRESA
jgi:hypothetical protein